MSIRIGGIGERPAGMVIPQPIPAIDPEPVIVRVKVKAPTPTSDPSPAAPTTAMATDSSSGLSTSMPGGVVAAQALVAAPVQIVESPTPPAEELPWSRPLGVFAENRMLRFLYLDKVIGWVFCIRFDRWYANELPTARRDPQPDELDRQRVGAAARGKRANLAVPPVGAADNRAVTEVHAAWKHEDLVQHDDKLRKERARWL